MTLPKSLVTDGIVLHGNSPLDTVLLVSTFPEEGTNNKLQSKYSSTGGIANLDFALHGYDPKFITVLNKLADPIDADLAYIIINTTTGTRTSIVDWMPYQKLSTYYVGKEFRYNHFAYLDVLDDLDENGDITNFKEDGRYFLTGDLAGIGPSNTELDLFDLVFCSAEDWTKYATKCNVPTIIHSPDCIFVANTHDGGVLHRKPDPTIYNPIGAGDFLAAAIIYELSKSNDELTYELLNKAYDRTLDLLRKVQ